MREVLIVIVEVYGAKVQPDKDVTKIQMMACWALVYTNKCYGMLVKENSADVYIIMKDKLIAEIVTDRFTIPLGGNFWNTGFLVGTAFQQSVDFMVIAIDEAVKREVCVRRAAQQMADLGHVMPDQLIKLNNSNSMG